MKNIYICTNDSIIMDLLFSSKEEEYDLIIQELQNDKYVIKLHDNYIMGQLTATYLKLEYEINCEMRSIE